ncbi:tail protein X [Azospirillum doebereinerae]|uniref:tail protein X n=1 Tax=Azospirillum doebereinerae TaxID=92933 RepID=UPI001EE5457E|nr:tail protein X [Azospirillum doebereinerae]MCG5240470.1 tail protein X [Azospirillum doebereinerae]
MAARYVTRDGDTVDWIAWKHYGKADGAMEAVLAANHGLADAGPVLAAGLTITLPDLPTPAVERLLRIWG